jgi:hypothetical protein
MTIELDFSKLDQEIARSCRDSLARRHVALKTASSPHHRASPFVTRLPGVEAEDYLEVPAERSVLSPAAYLVDLLRLIEDNVEGGTLFTRRPELKTLLLDGPNTESLIAQPALAVYLLEGQKPVEGLTVEQLRQNSLWNPPAALYDNLAKAVFPLSAPLDLSFETSRIALGKLGTTRAAIYETFTAAPKAAARAREHLGLSAARWKLLCTKSGVDVCDLYGVGAMTDLDSAAKFMDVTGITRDQLQALPGAKLDGDRLTIGDYDFIGRFIRLAADTGWSYEELGFICGGTLDESTLILVSWLTRWLARWNLTAMQLCGLWSPLEPKLFDAVFNPRGENRHPNGEALDESWAAWLRAGLRVSQAELLRIAPPALTAQSVAKLYSTVLASRLTGLPFAETGAINSPEDFDALVRLSESMAASGITVDLLPQYPIAPYDATPLDAPEPDMPSWLKQKIEAVFKRQAPTNDQFARYHALALRLGLTQQDDLPAYPLTLSAFMALVARDDAAQKLVELTGLSAEALRSDAALIESGCSPAGLADALRSREGDAWPETEERLASRVLEKRRDALVDAALVEKNLSDVRALYEHLLIDPETSGAVKTSMIVSAIGAAQLYLERCRMGLEEGAKIKDPTALERLWNWMKTYRLWEANRRVFLYPENFSLADARKGASPEFQKFQSALLQTDISDASVEEAFRDYADDFATAASLATAGSYVYYDHAAQRNTLVLIGVTRAQPYKHYYRIVPFIAGGAPIWTPWTPIDIQIKTREVTPVHAFGRVYLLWMQAQEVDTADVEVQDQSNDKLSDAKVSRKKQTNLALYASSYDLNGRWRAPVALGQPAPITPEKWKQLQAAGRRLAAYSAPTDVPSPAPGSAECVLAVWDPDPGSKDVTPLCVYFKQDLKAQLAGDPPSPPGSLYNLRLDGNKLCAVPQSAQAPVHSFALNSGNFAAGQFTNLRPNQPNLTIDRDPNWADGAMGAKNGALRSEGVTRLTFPSRVGDECCTVVFRARFFDDKTGQITIHSIPAVYRKHGFILTAFGAIMVEGVESDPANMICLGYAGCRNPSDSFGKWTYVAMTYEFNLLSSLRFTADGAATADAQILAGGGTYSFDSGTSIVLTNVEISDLMIFDRSISDEAIRQITANASAVNADLLSALPDNSLFLAAGNKPDWGVLDTGAEEFLVLMDGSDAKFWRMSSGAPDALAGRLRGGGVPNMLSLSAQQIKEKHFSNYKPAANAKLVSPPDSIDWDGPNGVYFWELFFHAPRLIAGLLNGRLKFAAAKAMLENVFDPKQSPAWRFSGLHDGKTLDESLTDPAALAVYHNDPFDPHALSRLRPVSYEKAVVTDYVNNLVDWGDSLFRAYTRETLTEAELLYVSARDILGRRPAKAGNALLPADSSYGKLNHSQEFMVDPNASAAHPYFGIPENDAAVAAFDRVDDRLAKLRAGLNIDGVRQDLPLFDPPLDPTALVREFATAGGQTTKPPGALYFRFSVVIEKAKSAAAATAELGSALLAALEKKDGTQLERLSLTQESQVMDLSLGLKRSQVEAAAYSVRHLTLARASAERRRVHYDELLRTPLKYESDQLSDLKEAQDFSSAAGVLHSLASAARLTPQLGSPFAMTYGGEQIGAAFEAGGAVAGLLADRARVSSELNSIHAGNRRRDQDWTLLRDQAADEADQLDEQLGAAQAGLDAAKRDYSLTQRQLAHAKQRDAFARSRFTSLELYQWNAGRLSALMRDAHQAALGVAVQAELAFQFETGSKWSVIDASGWDDLRRGLLSGETLRVQLEQLEGKYVAENRRGLQIQKTLCLSTQPKWKDLLSSGSMEFEISKDDLDKDFPGHKCRRIRSVAVTLPALLAPYQNVRAILTQTSCTLEYKDGSDCPDLRSSERVVLSRGVSDTGTFEVSGDGRYEPFEGTGAVSKWKLEILDEDLLKTLTEVVFVMDYSADA